MEDGVVDFGVDVFRVDQEAVYVEDAGADWWEGGSFGLDVRHGACEVNWKSI